MSPLRHGLLVLETVRNSPDAATATTAYTGNQKWDTSGIRNWTLGSLRSLELSTSNVGRSVALLIGDRQTQNKTDAFQCRREIDRFNSMSQKASEMGHLTHELDQRV